MKAPDFDLVQFSNGGNALAASVASHRNWKKFPDAWRLDIRNCTYTDEDVAQAERIRQYFLNKIVLKRLKGTRTSNFSHDLYEWLLAQVETQNRHIGMISRLPFFYEEDQQMQFIRDHFLEHMTSLQIDSQQLVLDLKPVAELWRMRRPNEVVEFWFEDNKHRPYVWCNETKHHLRDLLASLYRRDHLKLYANVAIDEAYHPEQCLQFYRILKAQLV